MALTAICDKWPDFFEVHQDTEDDTPQLILICQRKNSRSFQADQLASLRWLERAGLNVRVRVGTVDLTLDQFEKTGVFGAIGNVKPLAQSTFYNKQAELKRFERALETLPPEDPSREAITQRVQHLKTMLGASEDAMVDKVALKESDKLLKRIEQLTTTQNYENLKLTDEKLAKFNVTELGEVTGVKPQTPEWSLLLSRWVKARKEKDEQPLEPTSPTQDNPPD